MIAWRHGINLSLRLIFSGILLLETAMFAQSPFTNADIQMDQINHVPSIMRFGSNSHVTVAEFWEAFKTAYNISNDVKMVLKETSTDEFGQTHFRYVQYYKDVEIVDYQYLLHERNGSLYLAHGHLITGLNIDVQPQLSEEKALENAVSYVGAERYMWESEENENWIKRIKNDSTATFYPSGEVKLTTGKKTPAAENVHLVYRFKISAEQPFGEFYVDVDAHYGEIVNKIPLTQNEDFAGSGLSLYNGDVNMTVDKIDSVQFRLRESARNGITTLDAQNGASFANTIDFIDDDGNFTVQYDRTGVSAHWALEATYDYYFSQHGRDSYDNTGGPILAYVHWDDGWFNAQWLGSINAMRFGDGTTNSSPLVSLDVVGHEFTHGVTQYSAGLIYQGESGALNESFSDIFGAAVEFFREGTAGDWIVGEDFGAIRSMSNPNAFGDPDTYFGNGWADINSPSDNGGVHTNSGVQNHWFYLLTEGGSGANDLGDPYNVIGIGLEDAAKISYRNLTVYLQPPSGYFDARLGTIFSAIDLFGENSQQYLSVVEAWDAVGVYRPSLTASVFTNPFSFDFLAEAGVSTERKDLQIINNGLDTLVISGITVTGDEFDLDSLANFPVKIAFSDTLMIGVNFTPGSAGSFAGTVNIASNDPDKPTAEVALSGRGYVVNAASEGIIYGVTGTVGNGAVVTIDQNTGKASLVGESGFTDLLGATINPANDELIAVTTKSSNIQYLRVDALSGEAFESTVTDASLMYANAFDLNGDLYGARFNNGQLYQINFSSGEITEIGLMGFNRVTGLAINPADGALWGVSLTGNVYTIDKISGVATLIGNTGFSRMNDIAFDQAEKLFGLVGLQNDVNDLIRIDPATAVGSLIGTTNFSGISGIAIRGAVVVGISDASDLGTPAKFTLQQNYPNPFNPRTTIEYALPEAMPVQLKIYNSLGQVVRTLVHVNQTAGFKSVAWDGKNDSGALVSSGIYIYQIRAGKFKSSRKLLFIK